MTKHSRKKSTASSKGLRGLKVLVTAGPTREFFDPVRFLSNPSTGKMGYALAEAASKKGASVTLISGPTMIPLPRVSKIIRVTTAEEMYRSTLREARNTALILMTAAVSDYRSVHTLRKKIKKKSVALSIRLVATKDILKELGRRKKKGQVLVGFAAETDHLEQNARKKMKRKNLDFIVANQVGGKDSGFESDRNRGFLLSAKGIKKTLSMTSKGKMASRILDFIIAADARGQRV